MIDNNYYYNYDNNYNKIFTIAGMHFYFCFYMIYMFLQLFIQHLFQVLVRQLRPMRLIKDHRVIFFSYFLRKFTNICSGQGRSPQKTRFSLFKSAINSSERGKNHLEIGLWKSPELTSKPCMLKNIFFTNIKIHGMQNCTVQNRVFRGHACMYFHYYICCAK